MEVDGLVGVDCCRSVDVFDGFEYFRCLSFAVDGVDVFAPFCFSVFLCQVVYLLVEEWYLIGMWVGFS